MKIMADETNKHKEHSFQVILLINGTQIHFCRCSYTFAESKVIIYETRKRSTQKDKPRGSIQTIIEIK